MITISFLWLILTHSMGFYIIYNCIKYRFKKWIPIAVINFIIMIISTIYHWTDQIDYGDKYNFTFIGLNYDTWYNLDHYISALVIFLISFYVLSPEIYPRYDRICFMLMSVITFIVYNLKIAWYYFIIIMITFELIYMLLCRDLNWLLLYHNFIKHKILGLFSFLILSLAIIFQYYFSENNKYNLAIWHWYHGSWHFCMFLSGGLFIKLNNYILIDEIQYTLSKITENETNNNTDYNNIEEINRNIELFEDFLNENKISEKINEKINELKKIRNLNNYYMNKYSISTNDLMEMGEITSNNIFKNKSEQNLQSLSKKDLLENNI